MTERINDQYKQFEEEKVENLQARQKMDEYVKKVEEDQNTKIQKMNDALDKALQDGMLKQEEQLKKTEEEMKKDLEEQKKRLD